MSFVRTHIIPILLASIALLAVVSFAVSVGAQGGGRDDAFNAPAGVGGQGENTTAPPAIIPPQAPPPAPTTQTPTDTATSFVTSGGALEANLDVQLTVTKTIDPTTLPDLTTQVRKPAGVFIEGQTIAFSGSVINTGGGVSNASTARFCVDKQNCLGTDPEHLTDPSISAVNLNATIRLLGVARWKATAGSHTIYFCADATNVVTERSIILSTTPVWPIFVPTTYA